MSNSIWTSKKSRYGECSSTVKPVSNSTARRWAKENRIKTRRSITLKTELSLATA